MHRESRFSAANETTLRIDYADAEGGIQVNPVPMTPGESVTIIYNGYLLSHNSDQLYLYTGYGDANNWTDIKEYEMLRTGRGWEKSFHIPDEMQLNFCFKDNEGHWDNNSGKNWSYIIHNGRR